MGGPQIEGDSAVSRLLLRDPHHRDWVIPGADQPPGELAFAQDANIIRTVADLRFSSRRETNTEIIPQQSQAETLLNLARTCGYFFAGV